MTADYIRVVLQRRPKQLRSPDEYPIEGGTNDPVRTGFTRPEIIMVKQSLLPK